MYPCTKCNRTYRTQNSLTRHDHSHQKTRKHQCSTCGIVFHRKDLLSRHSKLHQAPPANTTLSLVSINEVSAESGRQRCHTACLRCRELRTKCDGQHPCFPCQNAGSPCEYSRRSNRLSHFLHDTATPTGDYPSHESDGRDGQPDDADLSYQQLSSSAGGEETWGGGRLHYGIQDVGQGSSGLQQAHNSYSSCSLPDTSLPSDTSATLTTPGDTSMTDIVSWPWLHENLFLSADPASFANLLDSMDFQCLQDSALSGTEPESFNNTALFQAQNHDVHPNSNALFCQAGEPVLTGSITQSHALMHDRNTGTTALESAIIVDKDKLMETGSLGQEEAATPRKNQGLVIQDLVTFASAPLSETRSYQSRAGFWEEASAKLALAFGLPSDREQSTSPALYYFCTKYAEHFGPLWPLLSPQTLDFDALHPLLFLVLTSIGSMYCGSHASNYGAMMHASIRSSLTMALELEDDESDLVWLAQARLLTQVAALYFGQPKAFTYAQHLGALLVAQARRMDLFSPAYSAQTMQKFHQMKGIASDQERLAVWLQLETRRRLAFGIFRGDSYTSVLLHTKPLVSMEEIDLQLPMCDAVWRSEKMSASLCLQMLEHDQTPGRELWASDIFRIAMDQNEPLPPLDPTGQELLMFGLQYPLWRFSKDQEMFARLISEHEDPLDHDAFSEYTAASITTGDFDQGRRNLRRPLKSATESEAHHLDSTVRRMEDLRQECRRLLSALEKWERCLPLVKTFVRTNLDRSSLMSGLILFHLGYLRLHVPLEDLHQIQYRLADNRVVEDDLVTAVRKWANSRRGRLAAERACSIWTIISRESQIAKNKRVSFNLLAFIGLHHGAVLLWAYAGAHDSTVPRDPEESPLVLEGSDTILVNESQSAKMLSSFVELYDRISPARWSSFAKAASTLSRKQFPRGKGV